MTLPKIADIGRIQKQHNKTQESVKILEKNLEEREQEIMEYFTRNIKVGSKEGYFAEAIRLLFSCARYSIGTERLQSDNFMDLLKNLIEQASVIDDIIKNLRSMDKTSPEFNSKFKVVDEKMEKLKIQIIDARQEIEDFSNDMDDIFGGLTKGKKGDIK